MDFRLRYKQQANEFVAFDRVVFNHIAVLQAGSQIRTPIDRPALRDALSQKFAGQEAFFGSKPEQLLSILVSWLIVLYEQWTEDTVSDAEPASDLAHDYSMDMTFLFRVLVSANIVAGTMTTQNERKVHLADGQLSFRKEDLDPSSTASRLAFVDLFSRLALKGYAKVELESQKEDTATAESAEAIPLEPGSTAPSSTDESKALDIEQQLVELKQRVLALEQAAASTTAISVPSARPRTGLRKQTQVEALASLHPMTIILFMIISYILVQRVLWFLEESIRVTRSMGRTCGGSP